MLWYVVQVRTGEERDIAAKLTDMGFQTLAPVENRPVRSGGAWGTKEMINVAQSNFSMLMDEMNRYPDLDTSEALIRLASHHVMNALTNVDEEQMKEVPVDKLIKETNGLIRAAAYKKRIEVQTRENYEAGLEAVKGLVFEAMAKEQPELYRQVSAYLNKKKQEGMEG